MRPLTPAMTRLIRAMTEGVQVWASLETGATIHCSEEVGTNYVVSPATLFGLLGRELLRVEKNPRTLTYELTKLGREAADSSWQKAAEC